MAAWTWARLCALSSRQIGRVDGLLQVRVVDEAHPVVGEGLLDHGEPVAVELPEEVAVGGGVRGVAVDVEGEAREGRPHRVHHGQVPSRPELELDPREALVDGPLHLLDQRVDRLLHAEVGAHGHAVRGAAEGDVQRDAAPLGVEDPPGDLEARAGELIALDEREAVEQGLRRSRSPRR